MQKAWTDEAWVAYIYWSRRIDEANRIINKIEHKQIVIVQCGGHYDD